ncbi:MAG: hypothetical protein MUF43_07300 [Flavobacterium sp.]|jgi:mobilome CxxCx(11)CxxC protein|nr:hypothetical protein [Flavobacterium sp.]
MEDLKVKIRQDCWDKALDAVAYCYIYSKKIDNIEFWLKWSKVLGIIIPVMLGGIVSSYYSDKEIMGLSLKILTPIALLQLIVSTYLSIVGSDEKIMNYVTKSTDYNFLASQFEQLAKYPTENYDEYNNKYEILLTREREISRGNHIISDKEKRMGMRYGLRNFQRKCVGCKETPLSMNPTNCDICGNF